jgi:hypothetical protein
VSGGARRERSNGGRAVIVRVVMPAHRPWGAVAGGVRPEREPDPDGEPGRSRYAEFY